MASDIKKTKADPIAKKADPAPKNEIAAKDNSVPDKSTAKVDSGDTAAEAPSNYSRGEGQKPVTRAYKENWNAIFAKKKPQRKKR